MSYVDKLPRRVQATRCCALGEDGQRCRHKGTLEQYVFLTESTGEQGYETDWVCVTVCDQHASLNERTEADAGT
jgi:hypothetical protein